MQQQLHRINQIIPLPKSLESDNLRFIKKNTSIFSKNNNSIGLL